METRKSFPDKKEIRKKHLAIRNAMSEPETAEKSRAICEKLLTSDWYAITDWIFGILSAWERGRLPGIS